MSRKPIPRRAVLQAGGAFIALPFLEAMLPLNVYAQSVAKPLRYACLFFPHGTTESADWDPSVVNGVLQLNASGMHSALQSYRSDISFLKHMFTDSWALHPGQVGTFLSAGSGPQQDKVQTRRTIDQLIADGLQDPARIHSLTMSSDDTSGGEGNVSGIYGSNISWTDASTPSTRRIRNSQIFDLLFPGGGSTTQPPPAPSAGPTLAQSRKSILDFAKDSIARTTAQIGAGDKQTLDQFLTSLREVEKKIQANPDPTTPTPSPTPAPSPSTLNPPAASCTNLASQGNCVDYSLDLDIKLDLMALAFQADRTRVATMLFDPEPGYRQMNFITGVRGLNHEISHWRTDPTNLRPMLQKITGFYVGKFARLLGRLKAMQETGGTVLDNSLILFGSSATDAHNHEGTNGAVILAGRAGGAVTQGAWRVPSGRTNISGLHLAMARKLGVNLASYAGNSSPFNIG
ncbi:MAG: DUF1552 domain-containing protein [Bdellovibrionales bacterium]|nr:DUF1552 domain-containing protein [Bdellovibrionales bacterium]